MAVFSRLYAPNMTIALVMKSISDALAFVAPLCVGAITVYVTGVVYPPDEPALKVSIVLSLVLGA